MAIAEINDRNRARCLGGIVGRMPGFIQHRRPKFKNFADSRELQTSGLFLAGP